MIGEKSLVIYKNRPAVVTGFEGEKLNITSATGESFKVREKDIEFIHPGPCTLNDLEKSALSDNFSGNVRDTWEILTEDNSPISLKELAELAFQVFSPQNALAAWELLREGLFFTGDVSAIRARPKAAVLEEEKKREEKERESEERAVFLEKLKKLPPMKKLLSSGENISFISQKPSQKTDKEAIDNEANNETNINEATNIEKTRRFLQDVEALALGKSGKSRTMRELGKSETPEEAHRLLLASGAWTVWVNPHPDRHGLRRESHKAISSSPAKELFTNMADEPNGERLDLTGLQAFAIDNPWSDDPDDALSLEGPDTEGRYYLWVHVADPASFILPGSPADLEARGRGITLYLPEGTSHMLCPDHLSRFALGMTDKSPALSIKLTLKPDLSSSDLSLSSPDLSIEEVDITASIIKVTRLSYREADEIIAGKTNDLFAPALSALAALAERRIKKRLDMGAIIINLPEVHIEVSLSLHHGDSLSLHHGENNVSVEPISEYRSSDMVRECMILAGEGAALWALHRQLPFPYISQEEGELPGQVLPGFAGAWQLRRCMRPRNLSVKPGIHWGLGLDGYTQVTSPLRRYTDLLCHQQIRAYLGIGAYKGLKALDEEEVLFRISAAEAAAQAAIAAERASKAHWITVYLYDKKDLIWEGVVLDRKGNRGTVVIPALGLETQVSLRGIEEPNDKLNLSLLSVKIPEGEANFAIL